MPYIRISRLGDCSYLWHHNENIAEKYMPVKPSPRTRTCWKEAAQKRGDKFCSVTGAYLVGLDPFELEREAGYNIGATTKD